MFVYACTIGSISWPRIFRLRMSACLADGLVGRVKRFCTDDAVDECTIGTLWSSSSMLKDGVTAIDGIGATVPVGVI